MIDGAGHKELGVAMAAMIHDTMDRPGFIRTWMFKENDITVEEFTKAELLAFTRIERHHGFRKFYSMAAHWYDRDGDNHKFKRKVLRQLRGE